MSPCVEALFGLRMRLSGPGDWGPFRSANAVDNLVPTPPSRFPAQSRWRRCANRDAGDRRFNRSSLTSSSASVVPVEKSGPDFHRVTLLSLLKSPIRSIPKRGSGVIPLSGRAVELELIPSGAICTGYAPAPYPVCFRAGSVAKAYRYRKARRAGDEVTMAVSRSPVSSSGTLPRFSRFSHHFFRGTPSSEPSNPKSGTANACTASCGA
jgi:hypothetical protein